MILNFFRLLVIHNSKKFFINCFYEFQFIIRVSFSTNCILFVFINIFKKMECFMLDKCIINHKK